MTPRDWEARVCWAGMLARTTGGTVKLVPVGLVVHRNPDVTLLGRSVPKPAMMTVLFAATPDQLRGRPCDRFTVERLLRLVQVKTAGMVKGTLKAGRSAPPAAARVKAPGFSKRVEDSWLINGIDPPK